MSKITIEQVRNEPAGRTMDLLIAEYVTHDKPPKGSELLQDGTAVLEDYHWQTRSVQYYTWPPNYSTNIAAAMDALESCKQIEQWTLVRALNCYWFEDESQTLGVYAATAPLAICRAALITVLEGAE